jgi:hypothetical protein
MEKGGKGESRKPTLYEKTEKHDDSPFLWVVLVMADRLCRRDQHRGGVRIGFKT